MNIPTSFFHFPFIQRVLTDSIYPIATLTFLRGTISVTVPYPLQCHRSVGPHIFSTFRSDPTSTFLSFYPVDKNLSLSNVTSPMSGKKAYFTESGASAKAGHWLNKYSLGYRREGRIGFDPRKAALLVIDMQCYFLEKGSHAFIPSAPAIVPAIGRLCELFRDLGRPIIFTRHIANSSPRTMLEWWGDQIMRGDPLSELCDDLDPSMGTVIEKSTYDAFLGTELEEILEGQDVTQVVICGVMTHLCCESTARSAFNRGFFVFFPIDGTATYGKEFHLATLRNLAHGFAIPALMKELLEASL